MSAIKDFFKKKKADAKFKLAGSGHKLSEPSAAPRGGQGPSGGHRPGPERAHPSQSSQQADAAALNRCGSDYNEKSLKSLLSSEFECFIFWVFPEHNTDFDSLAAMRDTLERAELDRQLTVLLPSQKISRELPSDFFNLTKEEVGIF